MKGMQGYRLRREGRLHEKAQEVVARRFMGQAPAARHPGNGALSALNPLRLKR